MAYDDNRRYQPRITSSYGDVRPAPTTFPTAPRTSGGGGGGGGQANASLAIPTAIGTGLEVLGGVLAGNQQAKLSKAELAERRRQFNESLKNERGATALGVQRQIDNAPLRDRLMYNMMQRLGANSTPFVARDMFNPSAQAPQQGGIDMNALNEALNAYQQGAGGVNTDTAQRFLSTLGYGDKPAIQPGFVDGNKIVELRKRLAKLSGSVNNPFQPHRNEELNQAREAERAKLQAQLDTLLRNAVPGGRGY